MPGTMAERAEKMSENWSFFPSFPRFSPSSIGLSPAPKICLGWLLEYDGENFQDDCTGYIIHLTLYS